MSDIQLACQADWREAPVHLRQASRREGHLMKKDDELHDVGVGLLPEGFLLFAEQFS
jgi:hypothetical protein